MTTPRLIFIRAILPAALILAAWSQQGPRPDPKQMLEQFKKRSIEAETAGLAEPFKGITTTGTVRPGLYGIKSTGVTTGRVRFLFTFPVRYPAWVQDEARRCAVARPVDAWKRFGYFSDRCCEICAGVTAAPTGTATTNGVDSRSSGSRAAAAKYASMGRAVASAVQKCRSSRKTGRVWSRV